MDDLKQGLIGPGVGAGHGIVGHLGEVLGLFALAAQVFDRQTATIDIADQDQDNFVKNMITIRAEERLALAVYYPSAIVSLPLVASGG